MAITEKQEQVSTLVEVASRCIEMNRIISIQDGEEKKEFPITIRPMRTTFILDADNKKTAILKQEPLNVFSLNNEQVMEMFTTPVTLQDGTQTVLGELLSVLTDQLIQQELSKQNGLA